MSNFADSSSARIQPTLEEVPQLTVLLINYFPAEGCECLFFACAKYPRGMLKRHQKTILSGTKWDARSAPAGAAPRMARIKAHSAIWSLRDFPALLAVIGAKINSLRSNKFLLNPMKAAMLTRHIHVPRPSGSLGYAIRLSCRIVGCIEGKKIKTPDSKPAH
jgi:hypothetical protein